MSKTTTQAPVDPAELSHADFRWFIAYFPEAILKKYKVQRSSLSAVTFALTLFGEYKNGTQIRITQAGIADLIGADRKTVRRVLELLKEAKAIEVVEKHQSSTGGKPSEVFRFRKSKFVSEILEKKDREYVNPQWGTDTPTVGPIPHWGVSNPHSGGPIPHSGVSNPHNRNVSNEMNDKNETPPSLSPSARSGVEEEVEALDGFMVKEALSSWSDESLDEVTSSASEEPTALDPQLDDLLIGLEDEPKVQTLDDRWSQLVGGL